MNPTEPISYRLSTPDDLPFIHKAWASSERTHTDAQLTHSTLYNLEQDKRIPYILSQSTTMVAYLEDNPHILLSFCTYQYLNNHLVIHYAFTKSPFREKHIQSNLLALINPTHLPIVITSPLFSEIFNHLHKTNNILYDHYFFQRKYYAQAYDPQ